MKSGIVLLLALALIGGIFLVAGSMAKRPDSHLSTVPADNQPVHKLPASPGAQEKPL